MMRGLLAFHASISNLFPKRQLGFDLATNAAISFLFFMHGAKLSRSAAIAGFTHWRLHALIVGVTFVVFPLFGLILGVLSPALITPALYGGILFICVLPSTVQSSIAFTSIAGGNVPAAIGAATLSNILGMFLTPLLVTVLISGQGQGFSFDIVSTILLQLLAPFILGQILQPWIAGAIARHKKVTGSRSMGSRCRWRALTSCHTSALVFPWCSRMPWPRSTASGPSRVN
jgi:sodium/bile acid cotransporter 7